MGFKGFRNIWLAALAILALSLLRADAAIRPIVYDTDPPVVVDGDLSDWDAVPVFADFSGKAQLAKDRGKVDYFGDADLGGTVKLCWRPVGLFVAAHITDNVLVQKGGEKAWTGDHVDLRLDFDPASAAERETFGDGQLQIILSPGNFAEIKPEIQVIQPQGMKLTSGRIQAHRNADGYDLEAFLPWKEMNFANASQNTLLSLEILISDSDDPAEAQPRYKALGKLPFTADRSRMVMAALADGSGHCDLPVQERVLEQGPKSLKQNEKSVVAFEMSPEACAASDYVLRFRARADFERPGGYASGALLVKLNGTPLGIDQLYERDPMFTMKSGRSMSLINAQGALTLPWSSDFKGCDEDKNYAIPGTKSAEFAFALPGMLKVGQNTIEFENVILKVATLVTVIADVGLAARPAGSLKNLMIPPIGELERFEPGAPVQVAYDKVNSQPDRVTFQLGGETVHIVSEFLTADTPWGAALPAYIRHERETIPQGAVILVRDSFENTGSKITSLLQRHSIEMSDAPQKVFVSGNELSPKYDASRELFNNLSVIGIGKHSAVGIVPMSDVLSVHASAGVSKGRPQIADLDMVLPPQGKYVSEFLVLPQAKADYWSWINAARQVLEVNGPITLLTGFAFQGNCNFSDETQRRIIDNFKINYVIQSNSCARRPNGQAMRGTEWINSPLTDYHTMRNVIDRLYPDKSVKQMIYFHCFLDTTPENKELYASDLVRLKDGSTTVYGANFGNDHLYCLVPSENGWAKVGESWLDCIMHDIKADGVFWDEFSRSNIKYAYNENFWDNVSADVDPNNGAIIRKKSSVTLLSLPWRVKMVDWIRKEGKDLIINGAALTRTMRDKKIQTMFETGQISALNGAHLTTPVALGDHLTEKNFVDAWRIMLRALDFGCIYTFYYTAKVRTDHPAMTTWMYPFTPVELHSGYVIGKERIITRKSGLFGWGDVSEFEVKVFDRNGRLTNAYPAARKVLDGKSYAEIRIPAGCGAVIIRK